ncbi:MAG: GNAT family N-acetyltransferase [Alteromonadales bacterium]|nr:GNAT family N-acetyltransferase [Alteromonadales bacterium]
MEISLLADCPHEAPQIANWYFEEWASHLPNVTEKMVLEDISQKALNRTVPLILVAIENGILVGVLELKLRENKYYPEYEHWIGGVFVASKYRGNGIAKRLLTEAKKIATSFSLGQLYLQCESHNVGLYRGQAFDALHQSCSNDRETTIMVWRAAT